MSLATDPFPRDPGEIGRARDGRAVALAAMTPDAAQLLGPALAAIDPWAQAGFTGDVLAGAIGRVEAAAPRYSVVCGDNLAGAMIVRVPWLHGPYLQFIGLLPPFHGIGIGRVALDWMEARARTAGHRNLWLCVSFYNTGARRLYERHGFVAIAELDDLVLDGFKEILMRKRLAA